MTGKLVEVTWLDAHSFGGTGWTMWDAEAKEETSKGCLCKTVGYVVVENKAVLALASSINFDKTGSVSQISGQMTIPRGMIQKVRVLT